MGKYCKRSKVAAILIFFFFVLQIFSGTVNSVLLINLSGKMSRAQDYGYSSVHSKDREFQAVFSGKQGAGHIFNRLQRQRSASIRLAMALGYFFFRAYEMLLGWISLKRIQIRVYRFPDSNLGRRAPPAAAF
ncbi:MAG: hypothetical protein UDG86_12245 [Lachnospiraceae bacterium]|jgi:hypothetical protein|nr:hypothetical protein [Lachnospiraceae bacterium]